MITLGIYICKESAKLLHKQTGSQPELTLTQRAITQAQRHILLLTFKIDN